MNSPEYAQLRKEVADYVRGLYQERETPDLVYHNLIHTEAVVQHAQELGIAAELDSRSFAILFVASWFHDVGQLDGLPPNGHEERSVREMRTFFRNQDVPDDTFLDEVEACILATKMPQRPTNLLEGMMCDADTYHFGTPYFKETNKAVKAELKARDMGEATKNWTEKTVQLLEAHTFFSPHAQALLFDGKMKNLKRAQEKLAEKLNPETAVLVDEATGEALPEESKKKKDKKEKKDKLSASEKERLQEIKRQDSLVARGIQTGLRLANENHIKLSDMADGKANILISVNSIIIGVILSVLLRRLEVDTYLTIPTMVFLGTCVSTIILAILATLPNLTTGRFTREDVLAKKVNLLFFGNFYRSSLQDYSWAMNQLLADKDYLYGSLVKDIYFLGVVLGRKYKLVRWAYYIFMFGLIASVISFIVAIGTHQPEGSVQVVSPASSPL
jgi:predicted metal-dependent HD superfamily phosphohydrolase